MYVQSSGTIQSPAELIQDTRGIQTLVLNKNQCEPQLVRRLAVLLKPFSTIAALEREMSMKRYTYDQAATMLDTSVKWLQRRVRLNLIPYATDGHRTWFELSHIRTIQQALREGKLDSLKEGLPDGGGQPRIAKTSEAEETES